MAEDVGGITPDRLKQIIERIERVHEEQEALKADLKEVYKEAKQAGFDTKIVRQVVKERARDPNDRSEEQQLFDTYWQAVHGTRAQARDARESGTQEQA